MHQQSSRRAYCSVLSNFRFCPRPPPHPLQNNNNNKKKPWSHGLGSRRSFVFQTETSDTKYIIFSFILDVPFLFAVRISLLLFLHMKYTQITLSRREKGRQNGKVESHEELKGTPPLFPLFLLLTPLLALACHHEHVEISLPVSRWLLRPYCHPGVHILARDISRSNMAADFCYFAEEIAKIMQNLADWNFVFNKSAATW